MLDAMENLYTYAAAILRRQGLAKIISQTTEESTWQDQGFEVRKQSTTYGFDNGVVIRRTVEQDDLPSEAVCAECWITYEVLSNQSSSVCVSPKSKAFDNLCRESFWLKYHSS